MNSNNPPAFPKTGSFNDGASGKYDSYDQDGMTLRDYFAAKAIGLFPVTEQNLREMISGGRTPSHAFVAKFCYALADAMLDIRNQE